MTNILLNIVSATTTTTTIENFDVLVKTQFYALGFFVFLFVIMTFSNK